MAPNHTQKYEIAVGCVLVSIATVAMAFRLYAKFTKKLGMGLDDWLAVISLALIFGLLVELVLWATIGGNGVHMKELSKTETLTFFKVFYANELTYVMTTPCIKLSILALYHHIFFNRRFRQAVIVVGIFNILFALSFFFAAAFQCQPVEAGWNKAIQGKCFDTKKYIKAFQSFNIVLDFTILFLPMPMVWSLQREWQYKVALTGVFVLGGFVCAASVYRLVTLLAIDDNDITYTIYKSTVWTFVEPCIGLLCACLPIICGLFPTFDTVRDRLRVYTRRFRKTTGMDLSSYDSRDSTPDSKFEEATIKGSIVKGQWKRFGTDSQENALVGKESSIVDSEASRLSV